MSELSVELLTSLLEKVQASGKQEIFQVVSSQLIPLKLSENSTKSREILETELDEAQVTTYLNNQKCHYSGQPATWKYSCYLFYAISKVLDEVDLNSQESCAALSMNQLNAIVHAVQECSNSSLESCVKKHQNRVTYNPTSQSDDEYKRLVSCLRMFTKFFNVKIISSNSLFDDTKLDYIIGVLSVISLKKTQDDAMEFFQVFSNAPAMFTTALVFKFLMMIRGFNILSKDFQLVVHREMMRMIRSPDGFLILCQNLLVKPDDAKVPLWQKCSMISKIIEAIACNKLYQNSMVEEIFKTFDLSVKSDQREITGACVIVLKNLQEKQDDELVKLVHSKILAPLDELTNPDVLLFGSIVMEQQQLKATIDKLHALFSSSTVGSLPSLILKKHIKVLFNLYSIIPYSPEREKISSVIVFFMINRERKELQNVVQNIRLGDDPNVLKLHPRICYNNDSLQIGSEPHGVPDETESFLELMKNSNNNFLIYDVFLCLINILSVVQSSGDDFLSEYNVEEEDLANVLHRKFFKKLAILEPLQEMIQWKSLHSQLNEKPKEILDAIKAVLAKTVDKSNAVDEQLVIIFFSLCKELIYKLKDAGQRKQLTKEVLDIKSKCKNPKLCEQIELLFEVKEETASVDPSKLVFDDAMKLLHSPEIYCKVYGSDTLIKLLKKRDKQTVTNRHTILAVALQNLKESESYAFLNIIRLLVALTYVMDSEVVDALVAEYQNKELDIDERLKIGEVIVKVTEDLGGLSVKFKQQLIKCFLNGSRDLNNEYRTSSLVNLGTICKVLSYQVHSFFQEMFQQLEIIIKSDEYLPSKRAATLVLSQILAGLPNLMDFQDFLLPIYHLLKDILANDDDPQTKLHAGVALDHLNAKTKDFLNPEVKVAKEIKISLDENPSKISEIKFK